MRWVAISTALAMAVAAAVWAAARTVMPKPWAECGALVALGLTLMGAAAWRALGPEPAAGRRRWSRTRPEQPERAAG